MPVPGDIYYPEQPGERCQPSRPDRVDFSEFHTRDPVSLRTVQLYSGQCGYIEEWITSPYDLQQLVASLSGQSVPEVQGSPGFQEVSPDKCPACGAHHPGGYCLPFVRDQLRLAAFERRGLTSKVSMYTKEQFGKTIDNTLLRPTATRDETLRLCEESAKRHFASVCILPCWVGAAAAALASSDVKVCTVVGFPFGATTRLSKVFETRNAMANGAHEIDAVLNLARFKSGEFDAVMEDLRGLVAATQAHSLTDESRRILLKVIIETCFLSEEEIDIASRMVRDAGADFVKTSTGTAGGGATADHIRRIRRAVGPSALGIKASGGIKTVETALEMLDAGANRIGTSLGSTLYDAYEPNEYE